MALKGQRKHMSDSLKVKQMFGYNLHVNIFIYLSRRDIRYHGNQSSVNNIQNLKLGCHTLFMRPNLPSQRNSTQILFFLVFKIMCPFIHLSSWFNYDLILTKNKILKVNSKYSYFSLLFLSVNKIFWSKYRANEIVTLNLSERDYMN